MKHLLLLQLSVFSHVVEGRPDLWVGSLLESQSISAASFLTATTCLENSKADIAYFITT